MSTAAAPIFCRERERLLEEFVVAVSAFLKLESAQLQSVAEGGDFNQQADLSAARRRKEQAARQLKEHQAVHGC